MYISLCCYTVLIYSVDPAEACKHQTNMSFAYRTENYEKKKKNSLHLTPELLFCQWVCNWV